MNPLIPPAYAVRIVKAVRLATICDQRAARFRLLTLFGPCPSRARQRADTLRARANRLDRYCKLELSRHLAY